MDRIAIISDIHGNREALKTTIEDINRRKCDKIICLGDIIAKGRFSNECVNMIRENCDVVLRGNTDDKYSKKYDLNNLDEKERQLILKYQKELSLENKDLSIVILRSIFPSDFFSTFIVNDLSLSFFFLTTKIPSLKFPSCKTFPSLSTNFPFPLNLSCLNIPINLCPLFPPKIRIKQ